MVLVLWANGRTRRGAGSITQRRRNEGGEGEASRDPPRLAPEVRVGVANGKWIAVDGSRWPAGQPATLKPGLPPSSWGKRRPGRLPGPLSSALRIRVYRHTVPSRCFHDPPAHPAPVVLLFAFHSPGGFFTLYVPHAVVRSEVHRARSLPSRHSTACVCPESWLTM